MSLTHKFSIEITPPADQNQIENFIGRIEKLFQYTTSICLSSHSGGKISGFERAYNFSIALLKRSSVGPLDITFHLTCHDINKTNIETKLTLLRAIGVKKALIITGEGYIAEKLDQVYFVNSTELAEYILLNFPGYLDSIAIAAYPGSCESSIKNFIAKCKRLSGIDTVYTQCVFNSDSVIDLIGSMEDNVDERVRLVPSVAVFKDSRSWQRCARLLRVSDNEASSPQHDVDLNEIVNRSTDYLVGLCASLIKLDMRVNICTFGLFDTTESILKAFV